MKLQPHYPHSFTMLLLLAFALVALPLAGSMLNAALIVDKLVREGRRSVATTVTVTRTTRQLVDGVDALQRAAVQNYVLEDPKLLKPVVDAHRHLQESISALREVGLQPQQQQRLEAVAAAEIRLYQQLGAKRSAEPDKLVALAPKFDALHAMALDMVGEGNHLIDRQTANLQSTADSAQRALALQGMAMVPLSLLLALIFSWLINRPVKQLAQAVRRLGENNLAPGQPITGPRDLVYLGEQVDWLRRRLIEVEAQKVLFLRHVSHELKTPLAALREGVELLADEVGGELAPQQLEITDIMRNNARELQGLIEELIDYSRAIHEPDPIVPEAMSLQELLAPVLQRHDLAIQSKELVVSVVGPQTKLYGDRKKLETVFSNLLSNSIRFSPQEGSIELSATADGHYARIMICDQGPGVQEQDRMSIWQPFFKGRVQPSGPIRGSGLGLAIVKEYVDAHNGQVDLVERRPWGACFQVTLRSAREGAER
ncbi:MAG TPA: HAMP domain-containing sensor histidine kinase [Thiobacillaceae bacterium]|nr:HAMP domain-containing sensor histidine kinase [Thiobacillaceae bacterium]